MKTLFLFFIAFVLLFGYNANAQTDEDNVTYLRVQNQIKDGNYRQGANLLKHMSPQAQQSPFFAPFSAACYENLQVYDSAALFYKRVYARTKDFKAMRKAAEMADKQDAKLSCVKCHGAGQYLADVECSNCNGEGFIEKDCYFCCKENNTPGKCSRCHGTGIITFKMHSVIPGEDLVDGAINCTSCKTTGKCDFCGGTGKKKTDCYYCKNTGKITKVLVCSH